MTTEFTYVPGSGRVIFGPGTSRTQLAHEIERLGVDRVLIITTTRLQKLVQELTRPFGDRIVGTFTEVASHVPTEVAAAACAQARSSGAQCLLSVGGGSATGTAKAVALETSLPIVAVPTTYAGSEMTPIYGTTSDGRKQTGTSASVAPKTIVYDPELTVGLPARTTGPSAMNAMAHAIEALYAPGANPVTSLIAEEAIRVLGKELPGVLIDGTDLFARTELLYGAYLAASALAVAGTGLHHKVCYVLGGAYDLPHAATHAIVLPHVVALQEQVFISEMARVAAALGATRPAVALHELNGRSGGPTALSEIGIVAADLPRATSLVLDSISDNSGRALDPSAVREILYGAYAGRRPQPATHLSRHA
jgi:maleylacetate reductase